MKKITTLITFVLILVLLGIAISNQNGENSVPPDKKVETSKEPLENFFNNEITEESSDTKPETPAEELTKEFSDAIKSTINFFSGKETKIVAIGDSLTQGVGDSTNQGGYVGILEKHLNQEKKVVSFENYGKRGNRSSHLLKRLEQPEIKDSVQNAEIILITIGANDIMQVVKENFLEIDYKIFADERVHFERRLEDIFTVLNDLNPDASIYLIGFYNPFEQYFQHIKELDMIVDDWNHTSKSVAEAHGGTFIPTKDLFMNEEFNLFAEDHFHPNKYGYQRIAERILNYLVVE